MVLKLNKITWSLLGTALLLVGGVVAWEWQQSTITPETVLTPSEDRPLDFQADKVQAIAFRYGGQYLRLYRGTRPTRPWLMDRPNPVEVSVPAVEFLLSTLLGSANDRDFEADTAQLAEYGLTSPAATLTVQLVTGKTYTILLGNADFRGDSLYALINPPEDPTPTSSIHFLPRSLLELARRSPQDWQQADLTPSSGEPTPAKSPIK